MTRPSSTIVPTRSPQPNLALFPDLFYLGPQRTGSTWLHSNMVRHPEIHIHRDKETFFFSTLGQPGHPRYKHGFLEDYLASFRESPLELLGKNYHSLRRCGRFYRPKLRADFTASYGVLPSAVIAEIVRFQPALRGIILVRDPISRARSHANKDLIRGRSQTADIHEMIEFVGSPEQMVRADYRGIIERWSQELPPGRIFVAPYGRISTDPTGLLDDISSFLEVSRIGGASRRHVHTRQNTTSGESMPDEVERKMEAVLGPLRESCRSLLEEIGPAKIY
jgi:hypothetical protein